MKVITLKIVTIPAPSFKICQRNSSDLAQCVKESIELIRPRLKTGDLGNGFAITPLEPINIDDILIQKNGLFVSLTNLKALGAANFHVDKLRINAENFKVDVLVTVPRIDAYGKYKLRMTLGVLNLDGEGNAKAYLGNDVLNSFYNSREIIYVLPTYREFKIENFI